MEYLGDFIKILLPAGVVLYAMMITVKSFLNNDFEKKLAELRVTATTTVLPIRLQAYERICLLLERISPGNIIVRVNVSEMTASQLQQHLNAEIRHEFNHNLSQQMYMSDKSWVHVKNAVEETISLINASASETAPDARGIELARKIIEKNIMRQENPIDQALSFIKNEIREIF